MRNISSAALAKLAQDFGAEPLNIVEIEWVPGGGRTAYSDRTIPPDIAGKILDIGALDNVVSVSGGSDYQSIRLTLDDTDSTIKALFDAHDVHQRPVWVYQWFEGLDLADKFLVFRGQISSPVDWNEGDRTFSFEVVSRIEEKEIGFSPEEGSFPQIPDSLIGKPWPMAFGTVLDMPAIGLTRAISGTTQQGVGIISGRDLHGLVHISTGADEQGIGAAFAHASLHASAMREVADDIERFAFAPPVDSKHPAPSQKALNQLLEQADALRTQANQVINNANRSVAAAEKARIAAVGKRREDMERFDDPTNIGPSVIKILGGEDFPQGVLVTVDIGGGLFTGIFDCQEFRILSRRHPENDARAQELFDQTSGIQLIVGDDESGGGGGLIDIALQSPLKIVRRRAHVVQTGVSARRDIQQVAQHFWAEAGSRVVMADDQPQHYIVSIVPGTVLAVKAYKRFEGIRRLVNVPNALWSQATRNFGSITAETVVLTRQLSGIADQGWEDDIYVTFESVVGPNTVNILEYLINTYSELGINTASFDYVRTKLAPFPSNFAIFDRPQILDILRDIAFQARCAVFVKDETVHLKYLPEEPSTVNPVTESDVENKSLSVTLTDTEDLVTKMVVKWRPTYADDAERKLILRHNVSKYGVKEQEFDWFIYNQPDIIRKAATFWLIRRSNTWKRLRFRGFLNLLNAETFDALLLDFTSSYVASGPAKVVVEQANYDSASNKIDFTCLVPVKAGAMTPYRYFWPAVAEGRFPLPEDFPGGANVGTGATGNLPVGSLRLTNGCATGGAVFIGGPNIVFEGPADLGDPTPQDTGFSAQPIIPAGTDFNVMVTPRPTPDLGLTYAAKVPVPQIPPPPQSVVIDISSTPIVNSEQGLGTTTLRSFIRELNAEHGIVLDTESAFGNEENNVQPFDFKFDSEGEKFGAGTAFLAEDDE